MALHPMSDLGGNVKCFDACSAEGAAGIASLVTAGGTGDATKRTGQSINRISGEGMAHSAVLTTHYVATQADAETLTLAHELQESADGSTWDTAEVIEAATTYVTQSGAGTSRGVAQFSVSLKNRKQYIRFNVTPNLSKANTDTMAFATVAVLAGYDVLPQ